MRTEQLSISKIVRYALVPGCLFAAVTLALGMVGKDLAFVREDIMMLKLFQTYPVHLTTIFTEGWTGLYGNNFPWIDWSYRPLEMTLDWGLVHLFGQSEVLHILFKSAVIGLCAVLVYLVTMEIVRKPFVAIASAIFSALSVPVIIESWWFHHMVGYTELVILGGLLAYLRYAKSRRPGWLVFFAVCSLLAPLLGEYGISLPLIALLASVTESVLHRKTDWRLQITSLIMMVFALYPQFLPNLVLKQHLVLTNVFARSFQEAAVTSGLTGRVNPGLPYLLVIGALTPLLTLMAFISLLTYFIYRRKEQSNLVVMMVVALGVLGIIFVRVYPPPGTSWGDIVSVPFDFYYVLPILFPVLLAVLSWPLNRLVVLWFLVSYLPFIKIYHLSVNLIPALIPWTVLMLLWIDRLMAETRLVQRVRDIFQKRRVKTESALALIIVAVLAIGAVSQVTNINLTRGTWGMMVNNTRAMGEYAGKNLPRGSIVLGEETSFFEALDMSYYSRGKVAGNIVDFYTYRWWPLQQIKKEELARFLADNSGYPEKYILVQNNVPQVLYSYLMDNPEKFKLVQRFNIRSRNLLVDPLYLILPRNVPYYTGINIARIYPSPGGRFHAEFSGDYALYKYDGSQTVRAR